MKMNQTKKLIILFAMIPIYYLIITPFNLFTVYPLMLLLIYNIVKGNSFTVNNRMKIFLFTFFLLFVSVEILLIGDYVIVFGNNEILPIIIFAIWIPLLPYILVKKQEYSIILKSNNEETIHKIRINKIISNILKLITVIIILIIILIKVY